MAKKQYSFSLSEVEINLIDQCANRVNNTRSGILGVMLKIYLDSLSEEDKNQIKLDLK